jgi:hypothetical protein
MKRAYTDRFSWGSLDLSYDYQPAEPQTRDHPGCPESIEIAAISFIPRNGPAVDLTPLLWEELFSVEALAAFEERILESMEQASPDEE